MKNQNLLNKTIELLHVLPEFCSTFYSTKQTTLSTYTQYNYAMRMKIFLCFLQEKVVHVEDKKLCDYTLSDLAEISLEDANSFISFLISEGKSERSAYSYATSISTYYNFFSSGKYKMENGDIFVCNPFSAIKKPQFKTNSPYFLTADSQNSIYKLLNPSEDINEMEPRTLRDLIIFQLLLDTGLKTSEIVDLNIDDIDLNKKRIYVTRNNQTKTLFFSSNTQKYLSYYINEIRESAFHPDESQRAVFLSSTRGKVLHKESDTNITDYYDRLTVRSIQRIVKKYAKRANIPNADKLTPKALRDTFALELLTASKDIALVQDLMSQSNISSTIEQFFKNNY